MAISAKARPSTHPRHAQRRQIEADPIAGQDLFGQSAPHGGRLLQPVAGKTVAHVEVRIPRVAAQNRVLIQGVEIVMPDPEARHLDRVEPGRPVVKRGPDLILEKRVVGVKVIDRTGPIKRRHGGGDPLAMFGAHVKTGMVDQKRRIGVARIWCINHENRSFTWLYGQILIQIAHDFRAAGACGIDHGTGLYTPARGQMHRHDAVLIPVQPDHRVVDKSGALRPRLGAQAPQKAHIVEPALAAGPE